MRSREPFDEFPIGFGERIGKQVGRFHPSKLGDIEHARLSTRDRTVEEMEFDGFARIVMRGGVAFVEHVDINAEFFP